jgi:hypothetical protein
VEELPMSKKPAALVGLVGMVGLAATGCSKPNRAVEGPIRLSPTPAPYFSDIPIPSGFTRVNERSMDLVSGKIRLVRHVFTGKADLLALRDFYCEQMPVGRWREVNRQFEEGLFTLRFEKDNEGCEIKFHRKDRILRGQTEISVVVMPRNLTEAPPTVKASTAK